MDRVDLKHKVDVRLNPLPGGQQRFVIVHTLAMPPQVMFCDEVTLTLDPEMVKGILEFISYIGNSRILGTVD
ncbi:hypothetical protein [Mycobacterium uberis]|uniref:hypothetical protein n=1 Tax=Mycobacterium uberis TaxID=2162698 RepID=UPI00105877B1|nr:hypothetical protein [Mycobacterium uberis]